MHLSPNHVSCIFSKKLKITLRDYINNMRISDATHLLANTEKSITEIMQECGFINQSTFNKTFSEICGMTPRLYRNKMTEKKDAQ
jgi:transcriptional regulator GlxA family with amidase domain